MAGKLLLEKDQVRVEQRKIKIALVLRQLCLMRRFYDTYAILILLEIKTVWVVDRLS